MGKTLQRAADQAGEWERKARCLIAGGKSPHFAPDPEVLAIFRRRLREARRDPGATALVLGATPELADIALDGGYRVVTVDRSQAMLDASLARRASVDPAREERHVADWRAMAMVADGGIDVVLGDAALNNVATEAMTGVIGELARVTRRGGMMLLRQIVLPDVPVAAYEFENALASLRAGAIDLNAFDRALRFYSFNAAALDPARHALDACRVFACIRQRFEAGALAQDEFDFLMGRYSEVCHTVFSLREQHRLIEPLGRCAVEHLPEHVFYRALMAVFVVERS